MDCILGVDYLITEFDFKVVFCLGKKTKVGDTTVIWMAILMLTRFICSSRLRIVLVFDILSGP